MKNVTISQAEYDELLQIKEETKELQARLDWLLEQLRLAKHKHYGASSEKSDAEDYVQLSLFDEAEAYADATHEEPNFETIQSYRRSTTRTKKDRLPLDLPVEVIDYTLEDTQCPACSCGLEPIGVEERERLKLIPAQAYILRERAHRYVCRACEHASDTATIIEAPMPPALLPGSIATAETVAHIAHEKFVNHTPLYRQEKDWASKGVHLPRQNTSNWLLACSERYFKPLIDRMHARLQQEPVLHADETTLQVLQEPGKSPQSKSYMWLYRTGIHSRHPMVLYDYQADRSGQRPREYLQAFEGYLQVDGYSGYKTMPPKVTLVGCWAHARRKFDEALKAQPAKVRKQSLAFEGKRYCDRLFGIEGQGKTLAIEARYLLRQEKAGPLVDAFFTWLKSLASPGKSLWGQAVTYCLNQEAALRAYLQDGRLEISNNLAERSIKPFVIGRKNFLFANTQQGAHASARIFSLVETAKANSIPAYDYLCWILKEAPALDLARHPERAEQLLPQFYPR